MKDDPILYDPSKQPQRVFKTQLIVCTILGLFAFYLFCLLRQRYPHIYAVRTLRRKNIKPLPRNMFSWMKVLYDLTDDEVLRNSGLDAFVFIQFFKMGIKIFGILAVFAIFIISPIRYYYTGKYDKDDIAWFAFSKNYLSQVKQDEPSHEPSEDEDFPHYLWVYPLFTYLFSFLVYYFLFDQTKIVLDVRQKYLGSQNSITDRTIKLDGIPENLQNVTALKNHIEELGIGRVFDVKLIYDWKILKSLFKERKGIIRELEVAYSQYLGLKIDIHDTSKGPSVHPLRNFVTINNDLYTSSSTTETSPLIQGTPDPTKKKRRPEIKLGLAGLSGPKQDKIKFYAQELKRIDFKITKTRIDNNFKKVSSAFVTMDSVASAQMAAQAVLDPRVHKLIANLAPAPKDVKWANFAITKREKFFRRYFVTIIIAITAVALVFPVSYLATLLNIKTITKFWPALGDYINRSKWLTLIVTGILPPYLFTLLNVCLPYFYAYLSTKQGYVSNGDIELSTVSKNFFYIFFNLFLVFTLAGTASNYWSLLSDTTKIAYQLATSLKNLSLFYVDLILLQGLGMFPFRLLQLGDVFIFNFKRLFYCQTPRDYRNVYYTPPVFNFGIQLPQPILILIITLIYSVISTKIVTSGLVYFVLGYYTYKYQLMYTYVHPPHSTGKVWPMIFRRCCLGLILFQLTMAGTLALEHAYILSALIIPLFPITLIVSYNFEKDYLPLSFFIALRSIKKQQEDVENNNKLSGYINRNELEGSAVFEDAGITGNADFTEGNISPYEDEINTIESYQGNDINQIENSSSSSSKLRKRRSTIDEEREQFQNYTFPYLKDPLNGPWIGFEGDYILMINFQDSNFHESNEVSGDYNSTNDDDLDDAFGEVSFVDNDTNGYDDGEFIIKRKLRVSEWE